MGATACDGVCFLIIKWVLVVGGYVLEIGLVIFHAVKHAMSCLLFFCNGVCGCVRC